MYKTNKTWRWSSRRVPNEALGAMFASSADEALRALAAQKGLSPEVVNELYLLEPAESAPAPVKPAPPASPPKRLHTAVTAARLRSLPNPAHARTTAVIEIPECTFLGASEKPDFAHITLTYVADARIIELKSLKEYMYEWRETIVSYERLADTMWTHLMQVYAPHSLKLELSCTPRGGISSTLVIDSADQGEYQTA